VEQIALFTELKSNIYSLLKVCTSKDIKMYVYTPYSIYGHRRLTARLRT